MKLKNKYTKKIDNWCIDKDVIRTCDGSIVYHTIAELIEAGWEDAPEEPKEYWYIRDDGSGVGYSPIGNSTVAKRREEIGNLFNTEEEAELAVRKLKAWKRLKDWGYRFSGIEAESNGYKIHLKCDVSKKEYCTPTQDYKDLDLLFGGDE